jgi:hypothetical protein
VAATTLTLPMLLAGCAIPGFSSESDAGTAAADPGPTWVRYAPGQPTTSPAAAPGTRPTRTPLALPTPPAAVAVPQPSSSDSDPCYGRLRPATMNGLDVVPGAGSATVTWHNSGDSTVLSYRVAAVPQNLTAGTNSPTWIDVPVGTACLPVSTAMTGLTSGGTYVFWLDAVTTALYGGSREVMIGRSGAFTIG